MPVLFGRRRDPLAHLQDQIAQLQSEITELEQRLGRMRTEGADDAVQRVRGSVVEGDLAAKRQELDRLQQQARELEARRRPRLRAPSAPETQPPPRPRRHLLPLAAAVALLLAAGALAFYSLGPGSWFVSLRQANPPTPTSAVLAVAPSPTPPATPTPPPTLEPPEAPAPEPTPQPEVIGTEEAEPQPADELAVGTGRIQAPGFGGLNFHVSPSTSARIIRTLPNNTIVEILEGAATADGFRWAQVRPGDGQTGWVVATGIVRG